MHLDKNLDLLAEKEPLLALQLREEVEVYFVCGLHLRPTFEEAKVHLAKSSENRIVLFEEDERKLVAFLATKEASLWLDHPQVSVLLMTESYMGKVAWQTLFQKHCILSDGDSSQLQNVLDAVFLIGSNYRDFGVEAFANFLNHMKLARPMIDVRSLKFEGVPAIICGAGPSLKKEDFTDRGLVFACGTAMSLLSDHFHFGVAIDPAPPKERFLAQSHFEAPLIFQNRVSHDLLKEAHGPLIYAGTSGSFPLEDFVMSENFFLDAGWHAANFAAKVALEMGCDPIILVGVDSKYTNGKTYAEGVIAPVEGGGAKTRKDLLAGLHYFEELASSYPDRTFIQTGGALPEGFKRGTATLEKRADLRGLVHSRLQKADKMPSCHLPNFKELIASCQQVVENYLEQVQQDYENRVPFKEVRYALHDCELDESPLNEPLLEELWKIFRPVYERKAKGPYALLVTQLLFYKKVLKEYEITI